MIKDFLQKCDYINNIDLNILNYRREFDGFEKYKKMNFLSR